MTYSWQPSLTAANPGGTAIRDASRRNEGEKSEVVARAAGELMYGIILGDGVGDGGEKKLIALIVFFSSEF